MTYIDKLIAEWDDNNDAHDIEATVQAGEALRNELTAHVDRLRTAVRALETAQSNFDRVTQERYRAGIHDAADWIEKSVYGRDFRIVPQAAEAARKHFGPRVMPPLPTVLEIHNRFASLSSAALRKIADDAENIIRVRAEDGVFD